MSYPKLTPIITKEATEPRYLEDRFADVINVKDFGAKGDGVADDTEALQAALDMAHDMGGGIVFLPPGTYRKASRNAADIGISPNLVMYSNTTLIGAGDASVIHFDSKRSWHSYLLSLEQGGSNFQFKDFKITDTLEKYPDDDGGINPSTNEPSECKARVLGKYVKHIIADNITFENLRYFAFTMNQSDDVTVTNCRFLNVYRDGVHCEDATNVKVTNNYFYRVCDDAVSICQTHSFWEDEQNRLSSTHIVSNNIFEMCQGVQMSGVKSAVISHNVFTKSLRNPINIHYRDTSQGTVYFTGMFSFIVDGNIILDTIGNRSNATIKAISFVSDNASANTKGNTEAPASAWNSISTTAQTPFCAVKITNNIIGWTLPLGVEFSTYNRGTILDRDGSYEDGETLFHGFSDPVMDASAYLCEGIYVKGAVHDLDIKNNSLFGFQSNNVSYYAIHVDLGETVDKKLVCSCAIEGNKIHDWPATRALAITNLSNKKINSDISIKNNFFDLDPYFRNTGHASTNKWSGDSVCTAIYCNAGTDSGKYGEVAGNVFKNCSQTVQSSSLFVHDNSVFFTPAPNTSGLDGKTDNLGIYKVSLLHKDKHFIIDGDPESDSFSSIVSLPVLTATAMPTTGTFVRGDFVENTGISTKTINGNTCKLLGWRRLTTGNAHVLGTDWNVEYAIVYNE